MKVQGRNEFIVRDQIRIFSDESGQPGNSKTIQAEDGTRFLVSMSGDINVIAGTREMFWVATQEALLAYFLSKDQRDST